MLEKRELSRKNSTIYKVFSRVSPFFGVSNYQLKSVWEWSAEDDPASRVRELQAGVLTHLYVFPDRLALEDLFKRGLSRTEFFKDMLKLCEERYKPVIAVRVVGFGWWYFTERSGVNLAAGTETLLCLRTPKIEDGAIIGYPETAFLRMFKTEPLEVGEIPDDV